MKNMDPFVLSVPFVIDPAYSCKTCWPERSGFALWSEKSDGPFWLYSPGSLEAWLFDRTRREAFSTCLNVGYPGRYRSYQPTLFANRSFDLATVPTTVPCQLYFSGLFHFMINGRIVMHEVTSTLTPRKVTLDLAPYLQLHANHVSVRVVAEGGPPVFLLDSPCVQTDSQWVVSGDSQQWQAPRCFPFEGDDRFPHQENLPELPLALRQDASGLYDAGVQLLARTIIYAQGEGAVAVHAGETCEEAVSSVVEAREQVVPVVQVKGAGECQTETKLAFRYLRLVCDAGVKINAVQAAASFYPAQYRGAFACSDPSLSAIWMHAAYTLRSCMQWLFVDGLKRDRLPWVGDLYACNLSNYHSFFERPISEYSMMAMMAPDPGESDINGIITYSLFWVMAVRDHGMHFGDSSFLRGLLPYCDKLLSAIKQKADARGLLPTARFNWVYVDWADVHTKGHCAFLNFLYIMALEAAEELHQAVGNPVAAGSYTQQTTDLRRVCRDLFWDDERHLFIDNVDQGRPGKHFGRQTNALAVLSGVCSPEQRPDVLRNVLLNQGVAPVGTPYMKFFEARALAACGAQEAMVAMIRDYWGSMVEAGASTFWEAHEVMQQGVERYAFYDRPFGKSLCHAWSSGPLHLLSSELFGLFPLKCGWSEFSFNPAMAGLEWACTETPTPQGAIKIQMAGRFATIAFPQGTVLVWGSEGRLQRYAGPAELEFEWGAGNEREVPAWRCVQT